MSWGNAAFRDLPPMEPMARSVLDLIGHTPVLRLPAFECDGARIYAKLEGFNPTGSVKDRTALELVEHAEREGVLRRGMTVVEASSGNTGIGLAMVCRLKGYPLVVVMSKKASRERIAMLRAFDVSLVLTSKEGGADEARRTADDLGASDPLRYCRVSQHRSRSNVDMHHRTTGQELVEQIPEPIDWFVAGIGTSATLLGVGRRVREHHRAARIIGVQPATAFNQQEGLRNVELTEPPEIFDRTGIDRVITIEDEEARRAARSLVRSSGLFCGISSGSALAGVLRLIAEGHRGAFATVFPDRGEKYLSTDLYPSADPAMSGVEP